MCQDIDMDAVLAREEFRWGVAAYQNGLFGEAVLAFERGLSYNPDDILATQWLANTYYRLGFNETALSLWERVADSGSADATLQYLIETMEFRRGLDRDLGEPGRYVGSFTLDGTRDDFLLFSRPASVYPRDDGQFYVTSWAGNQVLRFSANAAISDKFLGGVSGLDHPFDVLETDNGYLFISESLGDTLYRSDLNGQNALRFGGSGIGDGELNWPQYLAADDKGYIYVSEAGNRRVSKFDFDGNFVLTFGKKDAQFPGLIIPTGIIVENERIYVCDQKRRGIFVFDTSGNYLGSIGEGELNAPEGLSVYEEGVLLLADSDSLKLVDIENESVRKVADITMPFSKVTKAVVDVNGHILISDFTENTISVLSLISTLYTGLFVEITRIDSTNFPNIVAEVRVESREGKPVIGLDESNFIWTERSGTITEPIMIEPASDLRARVSLVIENSERLDRSHDIMSTSMTALYSSLQDVGGLSVYLGGELPIKVGDSQDGRIELLRRMASVETGRGDWRVDAALRLGATEVAGFPGSRAVILFTSGEYGESAFSEYAPDILAAYFRNNGISFYCVYFSATPEDREVFDYLSAETGGETLYAYRPEGIGELADLIRDTPTGRYFFQYTSASNSNFGDAYIPIQAEVLFFKRTGRGGSAYFPPREY